MGFIFVSASVMCEPVSLDGNHGNLL